jgi:hypothetical protein
LGSTTLPTGEAGGNVAESITLYLDLKPGEKADFEIVGLAAAAFADAVKEIAFILEPGIQVKLEFESGLEGSLKLKAVLKSLKSSDGRRGALVGIISTVGLVLVNDFRQYGVSKLLDSYLMPEQRQSLSDEDIARIANAVADVERGRIAKAPVEEMYRQLDRDEAIESVGSTAKPDAKPIDPVPRSEFPVRAGIAPRVEDTPKSRRSVSTENLTLISAVFLHADRVWRFMSAFGEHSYHIVDLKFLDDALNGKFKLKEGVRVTAEVETLEENEGGIWVPKRRSILKVLRRYRNYKDKGQRELFCPPKKPKTAGNKKKAKRPKKRPPAG